jgi:hypothetical protein
MRSRKSGLDSLKSMWSALRSAATGNYTTAMTKGQVMKDKVTEIMHSWG